MLWPDGDRRQVYGRMGWESPNREMYSWHYSLTASMQAFWMQYLIHNLISQESKFFFVVAFVSSDRSSCTDDGLLYIRGGGGNFFRF